AIA
ncbi:hypothetical protein VCHENC02_3331B, partial [Vibrio harveyi]